MQLSIIAWVSFELGPHRNSVRSLDLLLAVHSTACRPLAAAGLLQHGFITHSQMDIGACRASFTSSCTCETGVQRCGGALHKLGKAYALAAALTGAGLYLAASSRSRN